MSSFDYNAPAELFLSKAREGLSHQVSTGSRRRRRPSVMLLRNYAHPKPLARTLRSGMRASAAATFNGCTKPKTIRCAKPE